MSRVLEDVSRDCEVFTADVNLHKRKSRVGCSGALAISAGLRAVIVAIVVALAGQADAAQLGALLSPGPLIKAHASVEGKCTECHEAGRKVTASRCLVCHQPVATRIRARKGVHRAVTECASCHPDHVGAGADIRRLNVRTFNHATEAGYPLDGLHAARAADCTACHKGRTFLDARTACSSCHDDVHKGGLGVECTRCHTTSTSFKDARRLFDHTVSRFKLTGAHNRVSCEKCHAGNVYIDSPLFRGKDVNSCTACHSDPHERRFDANCSSCHTTERWDTKSVTHARTRFPLLGAHGQVACAQCHHDAEMTKPVRFDQCTACHTSPHRESVSGDCKACHSEQTFKGGIFDHTTSTAFPLTGRHQGVRCEACHPRAAGAAGSRGTTDVTVSRKVVDFGGADTTCVSCHQAGDPHKGAFGRACDSCHGTATFSVKDFAHPRAPEFYAGRHQPVTCDKCHRPVAAARPTAVAPAMACASCHTDIHLGQVGIACDSCHEIRTAKFAASAFGHDRATFPLAGRHLSIECVACHKPATRAFPAGTGTAVSYKPTASACTACHKDEHLGQFTSQCESCHSAASFKLPSFTHTGLDDFFGGFHGRYACIDCHKKETRTYPAGRGLAVRYKVGRSCGDCHPGF